MKRDHLMGWPGAAALVALDLPQPRPPVLRPKRDERSQYLRHLCEAADRAFVVTHLNHLSDELVERLAEAGFSMPQPRPVPTVPSRPIHHEKPAPPPKHREPTKPPKGHVANFLVSSGVKVLGQGRKKKPKRLTVEGEALADEYERLGDCSCHLGHAPRSSCTHPGNPLSLENDPSMWEADT